MFQVMIVDDMDIIRRELKRLKLWGERTGFEICAEAKNGFEALQKLEISNVDLVITDIKMPKIDGLELMEGIASKKLCSCVVLMSDYNDFSLVRQGLVLGAFDYLVKPVVEEELYQVLQRAKDFITNKNREQEKLIRMEQELNEKLKVYISKSDVTRIIDSICSRSPDACAVVFQIIERIGLAMNDDLIKMEGALKNILTEIGVGIDKYYPWLYKFYDMNYIMNPDFSTCDNCDSLKTKFLASVENCFCLLNKLINGKQDGGLVDLVCSCVLEHIDEGVSLTFVADKLFLNKTYISETFKLKSGIPFVGYLTTVKMERGIRLLKEGRLKVYEIGDMLGFKDVEYFSKLFKKYTGFTPTEYQQKRF